MKTDEEISDSLTPSRVSMNNLSPQGSVRYSPILSPGYPASPLDIAQGLTFPLDVKIKVENDLPTPSLFSPGSLPSPSDVRSPGYRSPYEPLEVLPSQSLLSSSSMISPQLATVSPYSVSGPAAIGSPSRKMNRNCPKYNPNYAVLSNTKGPTTSNQVHFIFLRLDGFMIKCQSSGNLEAWFLVLTESKNKKLLQSLVSHLNLQTPNESEQVLTTWLATIDPGP